MRKLQHKHVIGLHGITAHIHRSDGRHSLSLLLEKANYSLGTFLDKRYAIPQRFSESDQLELLRQMTTALCVLNEAGVEHRDIKGTNFLIKEEKEGGRTTLIVKIADFGLTAVQDHLDMTASTQPTDMGQRNWQAPEVLSGITRPSFSGDMFSFALLAWQIASHGASPFSPMPKTGENVLPGNPMHLMMLYSHKPHHRLAIPDDCPAAIRTIIEGCWASLYSSLVPPELIDGARRLTPEKVLAIICERLEELKREEMRAPGI